VNAITEVLTERITPNLPLDEHSTIEFLGSYDKTNSATFSDFISIVEAFKIDLGVEKLGAFVISGKIRQKEPEWSGDVNISIQNMDHILESAINLYNVLVLKFIQIEKQFPDDTSESLFLNEITDKQVSGMKNFLKKISLHPQDFESNWKTTIVFEGSKVTIGGKPLQEITQAWIEQVESNFHQEKEQAK
jgi:hypothetical protein